VSDTTTLEAPPKTWGEAIAASRYVRAPIAFVREVLGAQPDPWQLEALRALSKGHTRLAVRSGHGVGKGCMAAWTLTWFANTRAPFKAAVTAPSAGVKRVCIPNRSTKSPDRKREQKKRWFRSGQRWRTGCEGRISVSKRRHGLNRCRYPGDDGMTRWVGLGVIVDNLINLGRAIAAQPVN
jgi:hypothetical protein